MKCTNVAFYIVPRIFAGDAEMTADGRIEIEFWVWYGLLFWHMFGTVCCFVFTWIYLQHIAWPIESDRPINIVFVRPFFRSQFMNVTPQPLGIDLCNFRKYPGKIYLIKTMWNKQKR